MFDFPTILVQLIWLALPILTFIVCLKAKERLPGQGSTLMVIGSGLHILQACANTALQFYLNTGSFGQMDISTYYMISGVVGIIGQLLFLVGLYKFIMAIGRSGNTKDLLDYLPD